MKLTRTQELTLIDLGLKSVLDSLNVKQERTFRKQAPWNKGNTGGKWTMARRKKFSEIMKRKWANKDK